MSIKMMTSLSGSAEGALYSSDFKVAYCETTDEEIEVFLHGIVGDQFDEADSRSIAEVLAQHRGKRLTLRVNSPGGLAYDGVAIHNAIDAHDAPTTGIIEGLAGSAASLAVVACDDVLIHEGAVFHPHYSLILAMGHKRELVDALAIVTQLDADLEQMYARVSGRSVAAVRRDLEGPAGDGTRFSARDAVDAGYVDEIIAAKKDKRRGFRRNEEAESQARSRRAAMRHRQAAAKVSH